jgi:hypothetical protein
MDQQHAAGQVYVCPMHSNIRQQGPGTCPTCSMALVPEGGRFALIRHMMSSPLHILIMAALMIALMAVGMMLMR